MNSILLSSTGSGVKLRIKALFFLVIPVVNYLGDTYGFSIMPEQLESFIDIVFLILAGITEIYGWIRAKLKI